MDNIQNKKLSDITKGLVLLLVYSVLSFFYFHYSSHTSEGHSIFYDFGFLSFIFYFIVCLVITRWMSRSLSFNKQLWKLGLTFIIFGVITWIIPFGMFSAFLPMIATTLILFIIAGLVYNVLNLITGNKNILIIIAIVSGIILLLAVYGNFNDLSLKNQVISLNNSIFTDIKSCDGFVSPFRRQDCRKDYYRMYGYQQNTNDSDQVSSKFSSDQVKSIKVGSGIVANEYNVADIRISQIEVNGNISQPTSQTHILPELYNVPNDQIDLRLEKGWFGDIEDAFILGIVGMRVGGIRDIKFIAPKSWTISEATPPITIKTGDNIIFRIELLSVRSI